MASMTSGEGPQEWLETLRKNVARQAEIERAGIREGRNSAVLHRRTPGDVLVQAVGNRMRLSGRFNPEQVTGSIVTGVDRAIEEGWS